MESSKMNMNSLVPSDQLQWNEDTKSFGLMSKAQVEELIEACLRVGIKDSSKILKILAEYEDVLSGQVLFNQFLSGNLGIYEFDEGGSPVFEPIRESSKREFFFESYLSESSCPPNHSVQIGGRFVCCRESNDPEVFALYVSVLEFCSKWGISILEGENPEKESLTIDDPDFILEMRRRSWRILEIQCGGSSTSIRIQLIGDWLRTSH
jgi:hypothetical protein